MSINTELDTLKKLFSHSSEYVLIMNYDFEILWCNKKEMTGLANTQSLRLIFENQKKPLESREYFLKYNKMEFPCRIINYAESSLYVLQTSGEDAMFSCMKSEAVRHFFSNQTGQLRETTSGIVSAVTLIRSTLDEDILEQIDDYLNITIGKCRSILKAAMHPEELIKYIEDIPDRSAVDLAGFLNNFKNICSSILKNDININLKTSQCLYIQADPERLTVCLLCLVVLAGKNISNCGQIFITADRIGNYVSLTVSSESKESEPETHLFSKFEKLYKDEKSDPDLFVIYRFCRTCNGVFLVADNADSEGKTYSMKIPFYNCADANIIFDSEPYPYHGEDFSIYNIALSEISDII